MKQVTKDAAVALFQALGLKSAGKWNAKRMAQKLVKVNEMVDDDTKIEDPEVKATLDTCLAAIKNAEDIEVVKELAEPAATTGKGKGGAKKEPAEKKEPEAKKERFPGVREMKTRPFLAGQIIKKYGRDAGITDDMVEELDTLYGKKNPAESLFTLRNAWHAIRGFNE